MATPSSSSRTVRWLLGALGAAAVIGLCLFSLRGPEPVAPGAPAPQGPSARAEPPAPPPPAVKPAPAGPQTVTVEGQGNATVVSSQPPSADMPPPDVTDDPSVNPPLEPEKPQTPEWKLEKTGRIVELMGRRLERIEKKIQEAEAHGDNAVAEEQRILLERTRKHRVELTQEMEALRAELRADGGTPPGLAGGTAP